MSGLVVPQPPSSSVGQADVLGVVLVSTLAPHPFALSIPVVVLASVAAEVSGSVTSVMCPLAMVTSVSSAGATGAGGRSNVRVLYPSALVPQHSLHPALNSSGMVLDILAVKWYSLSARVVTSFARLSLTLRSDDGKTLFRMRKSIQKPISLGIALRFSSALCHYQ